MICIPNMHAETVAAASLDRVVGISLIVLLVGKELCEASGSSSLRTLSRYLDITVIPLLIVFVSTLMARVTRIL
jgi:hypothetical protein